MDTIILLPMGIMGKRTLVNASRIRRNPGCCRSSSPVIPITFSGLLRPQTASIRTVPIKIHRTIATFSSISYPSNRSETDQLEPAKRTARNLLGCDVLATKEAWFVAEDCIRQLNQGSDAAAFDAFMLLYDKLLVSHRPRLHESSNLADFLIDRELINGVILKWQQLHRREHQNIAKLMPPQRVLAYLQSWTRYIPGTHLASNTIKSWIIDAASRRSKALDSSPRERTDTAQFATNLLESMWESENDPIRPSARNVNVIIGLWRHNPEKAFAVLRDNARVLDNQSYHHLLPALRAEEAERIVREEPKIKDDIICWNIVLDAYAKSNNRHVAAESVQNIMVYIMMNLQPTLYTFNTALRSWARVGWSDQCAKILRDMQEAHAAGSLDSPPDSYTYGTVISAFAKAGLPEKAEQLCNELYQQFMNSDAKADLKPRLLMFTSVLDAYSRRIGQAVASNEKSEAFFYLESALRIWRRIWELHQFGLLSSSPDVAAYNAFMSCYHRVAGIDTVPSVNTAANQVDKLFHEIKSDPDLKPDFISYSIAIQTWLKRHDGLKRAMELLDEAWGDPTVILHAESIHHIVSEISRRGRPDIGQSLLLRCCKTRLHDPERLEEPSKKSFGAVLGALTKEKGPTAAKSAHSLVQKIREYRHKKVLSFELDQPMYQALISIWAQSESSGSTHHSYAYLSELRKLARTDVSMRPKLISYHNVLAACGRGKPNPFLAEIVLQELRDDFDDSGGERSLQPVAETFNMVLNSWARYNHPDSVRKAEALFSEVQRLHSTGEYDCCDIITYNIMLNCYANSGRREHAETAERLLESLERVATASAKAHGTLVKAWVKAGDPEKASKALLVLCDRYLAGENQMKPLKRHFDLVVQAWGSSSRPDSKDRKEEVRNARNAVSAMGR